MRAAIFVHEESLIAGTPGIYSYNYIPRHIELEAVYLSILDMDMITINGFREQRTANSEQ